jgi:hypothetical protein
VLDGWRVVEGLPPRQQKSGEHAPEAATHGEMSLRLTCTVYMLKCVITAAARTEHAQMIKWTLPT